MKRCSEKFWCPLGQSKSQTVQSPRALFQPFWLSLQRICPGTLHLKPILSLKPLFQDIFHCFNEMSKVVGY